MVSINTEIKGNLVIIHLDGELLLDSVNTLKAVWKKHLISNPKVIAFDCSNLFHVDSTAIANFIVFYRESAEQDVEMLLFDLIPPIMEFFNKTNLDKYLSFLSKKEFENVYL